MGLKVIGGHQNLYFFVFRKGRVGSSHFGSLVLFVLFFWGHRGVLFVLIDHRQTQIRTVVPN